MDRVHRVRDEHGYSMDDWYTASRESKAMSDTTENIHMFAYTDDQINHAPASNSQRQQNWPAPRHEPSYQQSQPRMLTQPQPQPLRQHQQQQQRLQPMYNHPPQRNSSLSSNISREIHPPGTYAREISQYTNTFGGPQGRPEDRGMVTSGVLTHESAQMHQYSSYSDYPEHRNQNPHAKLVVMTNLPKGVELEDPRIYESRPVTASTATSMRTPYSSELHSKPSRQHLLPTHMSPRDEKRSPELTSPPSAYTPPAQPTASSTQYSAATHMSRNKSLNDRYKGRRAGGDSCMGECCESCCGGCMRCTCCSVCCCMGPIITTIIVILIMVGIALALYFNWDKITNAVNGNKGDPAADAAAAAATAAAAAAPPAARGLIIRAATFAGIYH
ncbi:hypothetical protein IWW55_003174 [Coemansia sp. RSA 2706]|nr:hypothetical protein IWW55_003174 [Coemansia sp. RSA 2706]KAJ2314658.1 hypothetical protein IWW54_000794 [Coemansia sp. RSA 2705]KAJ2328983.1 hypothetical protein IWW51_000883 [Coemansia sp. RSA 2702]